MRTKVALLLTIAATMATATSLRNTRRLDEAPTKVQFGTITYGGTGCPDGTADYTPDPSGNSLSILLDEYSVEVGGDKNERVAQKSCDIIIPVTIPDGVQVAMIGADIRGFAYAVLQSSWLSCCVDTRAWFGERPQAPLSSCGLVCLDNTPCLASAVRLLPLR